MTGKRLILALFLAFGAGGSGTYIQQARANIQVAPISEQTRTNTTYIQTVPISQQAKAKPANAQELLSSTCQKVYGGGTTCTQTGKVILNKTIKHPNSSQLVESLSINDPKFKADQTVTFYLTVTNTDTKIVTNVTVQDMLPNLLRYVSGDGQFDEKTQIFSFNVDSLNPGESKTHIVQARVLPAENLPKQPDITCILNQARSTYGDSNISEDNVQLCIENKVLGTEISGATGPTVYPPEEAIQTPPTGANDLALLLLVPAGLIGLFLQKRSRVVKEVSE